MAGRVVMSHSLSAFGLEFQLVKISLCKKSMVGLYAVASLASREYVGNINLICVCDIQ